jgi:hypothetical protein
MTYNLTNNRLVPVRYIRHENRRIANPPDALVVQLGLGYPLTTTPVPDYNPETQYVTKSWRQEESAIVEVWTVNEIPLETNSEP